MAETTEATVIEPGDVYWEMRWGDYKKPDGSPSHPEKPEVERQFEDGKALAVLLAHEVIFLNSHWWEKDWPEAARELVALCVNCNDVFAWGCADAEILKYDDLQDLYDHWLKDRSRGAAVWCCKKRGELPQAPVLKAIKAAGIWDMDAMGLAPNGYDAARAAERLRRG